MQGNGLPFLVRSYDMAQKLISNLSSCVILTRMKHERASAQRIYTSETGATTALEMNMVNM